MMLLICECAASPLLTRWGNGRCVEQGSMVNAQGASEVWIKTLHTGEFAVVLLNKGSTAAEVSVEITSVRSLLARSVCMLIPFVPTRCRPPPPGGSMVRLLPRMQAHVHVQK